VRSCGYIIRDQELLEDLRDYFKSLSFAVMGVFPFRTAKTHSYKKEKIDKRFVK
jgi:hypothetical protein